MAAFEHEVREAYVFAAPTGRRARALQVAGLCVAMVSLAWIAALAVALLGAGAVPDALPAAKAGSVRPPAPARAHQRAPARSMPGPAPRRAIRTSTAAVTPARATAQAPITVASPRASLAPPAAPPPPPATPRQGWARRGWTAPPGRVKPDRAPTRGANGHGAAADDPSGTTPGQSGSHAHNG